MNNNNINTCGWIGVTHLDNIKSTSNILGQHIYINSINNSNYTTVLQKTCNDGQNERSSDVVIPAYY